VMNLLRLKLVAYVMAAVALASVASMKLALDGQHALVCAQVVQAHQERLRALAGTVADAIMDDDPAAITLAVRDCMSERSMLQVTVLDRDGKVLLQEPPEPRPEPLAAPLPGVLSRMDLVDPMLRRLFPPPGDEVVVLSRSGERLGVVRFVLSSGEAGATLIGVARAGLTAALALTVVLGGATYAGAGRIVTPLIHIRRAIGAMSKGGAEVIRVPLRGSAELVALARGVNDLALRLAQMTQRLATLSAKTTFINDVVQSMADTLIVVDKDARIKTVNQATIDLLGYTEAELVGRTASLFCAADGKLLTAEVLEELLGTGSKRDHEVTYFAKDGRKVPISLSGSSIRDAQGRAAGYVCIGTDISDRKQAELEREQLNKKLVQTSRQAGMAEVATGVLHNVGNVLNSVNVSASVVEETVRRSRVAAVAKLAELLGQHEADLGTFMTADEKGKMIPGYLAQLGRALAEEQDRVLREIDHLTSHIAHIKDIISVQQSIAKSAGVIETVDVRELAEDALRMVGESFKRHLVTLRREYGEGTQVSTDKHKVLQILVNLLSNAKDAVRDIRGDREVILRIVPRPEGGVRVEVEDNGVGIAPENLTRIFTHGFTTKEKGHGFGLHTSALAAKELQGSLTVRSDGPGRGALFTLELPAKPAEAPPSSPPEGASGRAARAVTSVASSEGAQVPDMVEAAA